MIDYERRSADAFGFRAQWDVRIPVQGGLGFFEAPLLKEKGGSTSMTAMPEIHRKAAFSS